LVTAWSLVGKCVEGQDLDTIISVPFTFSFLLGTCPTLEFIRTVGHQLFASYQFYFW